ncbi:MAG: response regulator [Gammaproteobacteria bacterium]
MQTETSSVSKSLRILLADDHVVFRQGLSALLVHAGFEMVGEAGNGQEAVLLVQALRPDVAILDSAMPVLNGMDAARVIHRIAPHTRTILLAMQEERISAMEALRAGMHGYVYKSQTAEELVTTIREVARGILYFSSGLEQAGVEISAGDTEWGSDPLTERERQVLVMIASGTTTRDIALALGLSPKTVESHRNRIMQKLHIHRAAELIRYAVRRNIIRA